MAGQAEQQVAATVRDPHRLHGATGRLWNLERRERGTVGQLWWCRALRGAGRLRDQRHGVRRARDTAPEATIAIGAQGLGTTAT